MRLVLNIWPGIPGTDVSVPVTIATEAGGLPYATG